MFGQDTPTFSTGVKVVNVLATVRDKDGKIVRDLLKEDFTLDEDGHPQVIRYFSRQTDLPLTLGLLVDTSASVSNEIESERRASSTFIDQVLRPDMDKAFVIHFDREVELLQDLTSSQKALQTALDDLQTQRPQLNRPYGQQQSPYPRGGRRGAGGGTALYDAVFLASDEILRRQQGRKAVILLSDGMDVGSRESLSSAIESAQRADTLVYSIRFYDPNAGGGGFGGPGMGSRRRGGYGGPFPGGGSRYPAANRPDGKKVLQQISRETGGGYFEISGKQTIERIYSQIEDELRSQYDLGYTSDQTSRGGYRKIHVGLKLKNMIVQARDGYYPS